MANPAENLNLKELMNNLNETEERILQYIQSARGLRKLLHTTADDLALHLKNAKIVRLTGAPLSIVAAGLTIGGFVSGFFTFGVGFGLCIAGGAVGGASATLHVSASATEIIASKIKMSNAKKIIDRHRAFQEDVIHDIKNIEADLGNVASLISNGVGMGFQLGSVIKTSVHVAGQIAKSSLNVADDVAATAFRSLPIAGKVFQSIGFGVTIVLLPWDIYTIVTNSIAIHEKAIPEKVRVLRAWENSMAIPDEAEVRARFQAFREYLL